MRQLIALLAFPILLLNVLGWLVAFTWLAIIGEWDEIGIGIVASIGMPFLFAVANMPSIGFVSACAYLMEKKRPLLALPFVFLGSLWTNLLVMAWCSIVFFHYARVATSESYTPLMLWGYSVAMAPLAYMAKFDVDSPFTGFILFIAQILFLGLVVCHVMGTSIEVALIFILILSLIVPSIAIVAGMASLSR